MLSFSPDEFLAANLTRTTSSMFIEAISAYVPSRLVDNSYFSAATGKPESWFKDRVGIETRSRASLAENASTMAVSSVEMLLPRHSDRLQGVDLIIGASYTPFDTVGTIAHRVQKNFRIANAKCFFLSSACSSFLNSIEIAQAFFQTKKASSALIVVSEHNSGFADDHDPQSGHLWGDGAAAILIGSRPSDSSLFEVVDVETRGLGHLGDGPDGVHLRPTNGGLVMQNGRDVFNFACREMTSAVEEIVGRNKISLKQITKLVPHQANPRIIEKIIQNLKFPAKDVLMTVKTLGNTGCASIPITLSQSSQKIKTGDWLVLAAFGGGYSSGAALMRCINPY